MSEKTLTKQEEQLAKLVDGTNKIDANIPQDEINEEIEKAFKRAREITKEKVGVKKESKIKRAKLGTEVAIVDTKKTVKQKQQNDRIEFITKRDRMFQLTESSAEYKRLFKRLDSKQQLDVVKYFFEAIKENELNDVANGERFPTTQELQVMKFLKGHLYLYYAGINERLSFIKLNKLPFVGNDYKIADIGRMIESRFTGQGTMFSSGGEDIDLVLKNKIKELKSKTKDIRYKEDV